jgi:uncharacterized protein YggE
MTMRRLRPFSFLFVLLCSLCGAVAVPAQAQGPVTGAAVIVVTGESRVKVAPNQAWVVVAVETRDARGPEARRLGAAAMTSVMAAIRKTAVPANAIQTIGFSLHPEYDYSDGRQRMKGFVVSNQLQVRIDDINAVAEVLDAVGSLALPASSIATIGSLRFDLKNRSGYERDALIGAVKDARAKAAAMAMGADMTMGRVLRIEEGGADSPMMQKFEAPMAMARAGDAMISTPIAPSDIEVRAQVTMTIEIK